MPSAASCSLSLALVVAGYFYSLCATPPNSVTTPYRIDRIRCLTGHLATASANIATPTLLYQALITLLYDSDREVLHWICPHLNHLRDERFTWNERTTWYLLILAVGVWIRLSAYRGLGRNFTFRLAMPDHLVTTGVYQFMQHPSYTGLCLAVAGHLSLVVNQWDTALACWIPGSLLGRLRQWPLGPVGALLGLVVLRIRVLDEERMLKERFGRQWEDWHRRTARFIPGIV